MSSRLVSNLDSNMQYGNRLESEDIMGRFGFKRVLTRYLSLR